MNMFTKVIGSAFFAASVLFLSTAEAQLYLITGGKIQGVSNSTLKVGDLAFPVSPTVKVFSAKKKPIALKDLKIGDTVRVEVHEVAGKRFVDSISLVPARKRK